ncbi:hypothetical protein [Kribbella sp. NPDC048928]|uniref:hypothetical protein n=1 Tax=Kribbella sp. NPDC048928 TaxID=3364111 RepID=UPI003717BB8E
MRVRQILAAGVGVLASAITVGGTVAQADPPADPDGTRVTVVDPNGTRVTSVDPDGTRVTSADPDGTRVT